MQLVLNLCLNARDAMPGGGTLGVRVERRTPPGEAAPAVPEAAIVISDTGMGMAAETLQHVFDPFFTTKSKAGSLGCGLAIAHAVAKGHGGHIDVESLPAQGTVFTARLPLSREPRVDQPSKTVRPEPATAAQPSRFQILVVDDEPVVRRSLRRLLTRAGYGVLEAADGVEALESYAQANPRPDVVLLDLDMPGMGGLQTAARLADLDARAKVVFISGHLDRSRDTVPPEARILAKPCDARELLAQVRGAMAADTDFDEETCRLSVAPAARR
jgi:CheY-like chemotaxis protein